jgi:hypothetical protein
MDDRENAKARRELERYRAILRDQTDEKARQALTDLIAELESGSLKTIEAQHAGYMRAAPTTRRDAA